MNKKDISEVMKELRKKRKDYSTSGFNNPEVQARVIAARKLKAKERKNDLKDTEQFQKFENLGN